MRLYLILAGLAFLFTAGVHATRIILGWSAVVNGVVISTTVDIGTIIVALALAIGAFWFAVKRR